MACTGGVVLHAAFTRMAISTTPTARNPHRSAVPDARVPARIKGWRAVPIIVITLHVTQAKINRRRASRQDSQRRWAAALTAAGLRCTYLD